MNVLLRPALLVRSVVSGTVRRPSVRAARNTISGALFASTSSIPLVNYGAERHWAILTVRVYLITGRVFSVLQLVAAVARVRLGFTVFLHLLMALESFKVSVRTRQTIRTYEYEGLRARRCFHVVGVTVYRMMYKKMMAHSGLSTHTAGVTGRARPTCLHRLCVRGW